MFQKNSDRSHFRSSHFGWASGLTPLFLALALAAIPAFAASGVKDPDADYDRLDGTGKSGKTVNVIEWEGNLELHVTPVGSLKGLALKLDKKNKDKPVMVIAYRFDTDPREPLIRRAILGIPIYEGFKVYRDRSASDYDKIVITNNTLGSPEMTAFRLDPEPKQLYPEGHPALGDGSDGKNSGDSRDRGGARARVVPSGAQDSAPTADSSEEVGARAAAAAERQRAREAEAQRRLQDDGAITPFFGGAAR